MLNEPSVVAIEKGSDNSQRVKAVGKEAKEMLGKTPGTSSPFDRCEMALSRTFRLLRPCSEHFIKKVHNRSHFIRSRLIISVPAGITNVERKAVREAAENAGYAKFG